MKGAFVVIKAQKQVFERDFALTQVFRKNGLVFDETRIISCDSESCKRTFSELKNTFDIVVAVAEKGYLPALQQTATGVYSENTFQSIGGGAGVFVEQNKVLFLLPLYNEQAVSYINEVGLPMINKLFNLRLDRIVIRCVGASRDRVISLIAKANEISQNKMRITHDRNYDEEVIEIVYGENVSKMQIDDIMRLFVDGLGDTVYAMDDTPLAERLIEILKLRRRKISVAESFTGGGISRRIVSVWAYPIIP